MATLKIWFLETRPQYLTLPLALAFLGTVLAWSDGHFSLFRAILACFGLIVTHISVNTLNDYFDYRSGVDLVTRRTPFSGGSGMLPAGLLTPKQVLWLGLVTFIVAVPIGLYFIFLSGWQLLPLLLVAAFCILLYSPFILKQPWPEWAPGVGLGLLPVLGMYFVQMEAYTWHAVIASVPSAFLVHNLLLLNEFPDVAADRTAGRKTLPIMIGEKRAAGFYTFVTLAVYVWIIAWVIAGVMPVWVLLALLTLPFAIKAIVASFDSRNEQKLLAALPANVMVVLLTQVFLGIGYILAKCL